MLLLYLWVSDLRTNQWWLRKASGQLNVGTHYRNPNTREAEVGVQGPPGLHCLSELDSENFWYTHTHTYIMTVVNISKTTLDFSELTTKRTESCTSSPAATFPSRPSPYPNMVRFESLWWLYLGLWLYLCGTSIGFPFLSFSKAQHNNNLHGTAVVMGALSSLKMS